MCCEDTNYYREFPTGPKAACCSGILGDVVPLCYPRHMAENLITDEL